MLFKPSWIIAAVVAASAAIFASAPAPTFAAAPADDQPSALPDGNYLLTMSRSSTVESRIAIVKVETKDGKPTASVLSSGPAPRIATSRTEVSDLKVDGKTVSLTVNQGLSKLLFEGTTDSKNPKRVVGVMDVNGNPIGAALTRTDLTELKASDITVIAKAPAAMEAFQKASAFPTDLVRRANEAATKKDRAEQLKIRQELMKHREESDKKAPELLRAVIKETPDGPYAILAATQLLSRVSSIDASPEEVQGWAKLIEDDARPYGPRLERSAQLRIANLLGSQAKYAELAQKYAESALTGDSLKTNERASGIKLLVSLNEKAGKADAATKLRDELAKLEAVLDEEYHKNVPPFQPEKFTGRKSADANRVLAMELFTGTQCPPCVAADVAFDGLIKTYEPKDVVFLQYHEHIPGPDPLTNPDTNARMDYYRKFFETGFGGTPSTAFNGKADAYGGGGMANSEAKYNQYRRIIDPALDQSTEIKIKGSAKKEGDAVIAQIEVAGLKEPSESLNLVLALTEENVRYVGSNNVRFHHHVVRSLFGKVEGIAVKDLKDGKHEASVNLATLRADLTRYLDDYAKQRPFANPDRPLDLKGLKIVALIQDAKTAEIVQAAEIDVEGQEPRKP